ncbi:MAG: hypothetical protein J6M18_05400, partial [Actinomycetaceae bacterium]|nr:hypothetical protein [Actinomycetaceae bacterium]
MSISYTLLITPSQADSYMNDGIDLCGGFAIVSSDIASVVRVEDFISLFHGTIDGSPFSPDRPVDILEIPADPFVQARHAVGPLDPRAVLGGIIELPPFDGTGRVQTALTSADLLWIEPTRIPIGSQLKRYYPGRPEPQHVATYHGVAWGWQAEATQSFSAFIPSPFIGATIQRDWGDVPVDVEYGDDGSIVALTLISPTEPKMEQGFEKIESGMWAKRIAYRPGMEVREKHMVGRVGNIPVRILRTMRDEDGELFAFCVSLLLDMPLVLASGFVRWGQAYAVTTVPFVSVKPSVQYVPYVPLADDVPV